jgi:hypothetical protein
MVIGGTVYVDYYDFYTGEPDWKAFDITVTRRNWSWVPDVQGQQGTAGQIDTCLGSAWEDIGLMASVSCTPADVGRLFIPTSVSSGAGYVAAQIPSGVGYGPNQGLHYAAGLGASPVVNLRTQVTRKFRPDGDTLSLAGPGYINTVVRNACLDAFGNTLGRNHNTVNSACIFWPGSPAPAWSAFIACAWQHEAKHLDSALTAARRPLNDVHKLFEKQVAKSATDFHNLLNGVYNVVNNRVKDVSLAAHGSMIYQPTAYLYANQGAGWSQEPFSIPC